MAGPNSAGANSAVGKADFLLQLVDLGLLSILFIAPLLMGGRHPVGRLVYVSLVGITASAWAARQAVRQDARYCWTGAEPLLLAAVLLVVMQLLPWPPWLLAAASPEIGQLLPLWTGDAVGGTTLGTWSRMSLAPEATRAGLVTLLAHGMLFLVAVQRLGTREDIHRLLRWMALAAVGMAVLGLAQFLAGNGRFLWVYAHPSRDTLGVVKGTFQNQNHFAHFLALGVGPLVWWLDRSVRRAGERGGFRFGGQASRSALRGALPALGLGLVAVAGALTFSRGGVIAIALAAAVCLGVLWRLGRVDRRILGAFAGVVLLLGAVLSIHGYEPLARRLNTLRAAQSLDELSHGRAALWAAHRQIVPRFPWLGTGTGSHAEIYRTYFAEDANVEFTHGESGYLHVLVENGAAGVLLALAAGLLAVRWCFGILAASGDEGSTAAGGALLAGIAASLVHSCGDFVWYIPSCMSATLLLAAAACRLHRLTAGRSAGTSARIFPSARPSLSGVFAATPAVRAAVAGTVVALSVLLVAANLPRARSAPHWDAYFRLAREGRGDDARSLEDTRRMADQLQALLAHDPYHARAHLRLAVQYLRLFDLAQQASENPLGLQQIRDAALASDFPDQPSLDRWLAVVMGPRRAYLERALQHTRWAVRLCPLQGEGYVYLAELAFLADIRSDAASACIQQALRVRPFSGPVLLAAGSEAAMAGEAELAIEYWKRAFHLDVEQRDRVIAMLADGVPADEFVNTFEPDRAALLKLFDHYRQRGARSQAIAVTEPLLASIRATVADDPPSLAAALWDRATDIHRYRLDPAAAVPCAREAARITPQDYSRRRSLALLLAETDHYQEAIEQLKWCLVRRPDDALLRQRMVEVARVRIARRDEPPAR